MLYKFRLILLMKSVLTVLLWLGTGTAFAQTRSSMVSFDKPTSVAPAPGYSHTVRVKLDSATMLLVSGQVALDKQGNVVGWGDAPKQFEQVFANIKSLVEEAGGTMSQVVKLNYYLLDMAQLPQLRAVRDRYINTAAPPASTAVQVSRLFRDELLVEIEAMAVIPE